MGLAKYSLILLPLLLASAQEVQVTAELRTPEIWLYETPEFSYTVHNPLEVPVYLGDLRGKRICEECEVWNDDGVRYNIKPVGVCGTGLVSTFVKPGGTKEEIQPLNMMGIRTAFGWCLPPGKWHAVFGLRYSYQDGDTSARVLYQSDPVKITVLELPDEIRKAVREVDSAALRLDIEMQKLSDRGSARDPLYSKQLDTLQSLLALELPKHLYEKVVEKCVRAALGSDRNAECLDVLAAAFKLYPDVAFFAPYWERYTPEMIEKYGAYMRAHIKRHPNAQASKWYKKALDNYSSLPK